MQDYAAQAPVDAFAQVRAYFVETLVWLESGQAAALPHGELEDQAGERGRELQRRMFQGYLDLRAAREERRR